MTTHQVSPSTIPASGGADHDIALDDLLADAATELAGIEMHALARAVQAARSRLDTPIAVKLTEGSPRPAEELERDITVGTRAWWALSVHAREELILEITSSLDKDEDWLKRHGEDLEVFIDRELRRDASYAPENQRPRASLREELTAQYNGNKNARERRRAAVNLLMTDWRTSIVAQLETVYLAENAALEPEQLAKIRTAITLLSS